MDGFKPQELSNMSMAYQKMDIDAPELFDAIASESLKKMGNFNPLDLCTMAKTYEEMEVPHLFDALVNETIKKIKTFDNFPLIMMATALDVASFPLNDWQSEQLQPYFDKVQKSKLDVYSFLHPISDLNFSDKVTAFATAGINSTEDLLKLEDLDHTLAGLGCNKRTRRKIKNKLKETNEEKDQQATEMKEQEELDQKLKIKEDLFYVISVNNDVPIFIKVNK